MTRAYQNMISRMIFAALLCLGMNACGNSEKETTQDDASGEILIAGEGPKDSTSSIVPDAEPDSTNPDSQGIDANPMDTTQTADGVDLDAPDTTQSQDSLPPTDTGASTDTNAGQDSVDAAGEEVFGTPVEVDPAWPPFWNHTASSKEHVAELVKEALEGLGFAKDSQEGPGPSDRIFVGRYYMAWIDQTGFVGKINGLWRLNGAENDALNFVVRDNGRPLNFFIVGEKGDGTFAGGYPGSEHAEFPNTTPEPNDNPSCGDGDWCNQYAHDEAASITDPDIPWWSSCNKGQSAWDVVHEPIEAELVEGGIRLLWEAPLVKEADGDQNWDADDCHEHWLFPDGIRRPVYLQVGYELYANQTHVDRIMYFRNPEGNPEFTGPMSVIGGFVLTGWPDAHPLKRLNAWVRPTVADLWDPTHNLTLAFDTWNDHQLPHEGGDEVFGWVKNAYSLSAFPEFIAGRSATLSHIGLSDNDDVGFCLCSVHGGLEMGGGLLHGEISLPIAGGSQSSEARRRLDLPGDPLPPQVHIYQAETDLGHAIGKAEADGWSANTADDDAGHLVFGPYATDWFGSSGSATFRMMIDNNSYDTLEVVVLDIYDATAGKTLATLAITRDQFAEEWTYEEFYIDFDLTGSVGHSMEVRAYWKDISYLRIDWVKVVLAN